MRQRDRHVLLVAASVAGLLLLVGLAEGAEARANRTVDAIAILAVATIALGAWWSWRRAGHAAERGAARLGLHFSRHDTLDLLTRPFALFSGPAITRGVGNVAWGSRSGSDIVLFDYWEADRGDSQGPTYHACALSSMPFTGSAVAVHPVGVLARAATSLGLRGIEFESEEFNRRFHVQAADRRFASAVVDARLVEWMLGTTDGTGFELLDASLLVFGAGKASSDYERWLATLERLRERIPPVARSLAQTDEETGPAELTDRERRAPRDSNPRPSDP